MRLIASFIAGVALAAAPIAAQNCSDLTVTAGTDTVTFAVTGATATSPTFILIGETAGVTSIPLGMLGTLDLGLVAPFIPMPIGATDDMGAASHMITIPANVSIPAQTLFAQALTLSLTGMPGTTFGLGFCTSDVASFMIGGTPVPTPF